MYDIINMRNSRSKWGILSQRSGRAGVAEEMESLQVELPEGQHLGRVHRDISLIVAGGGEVPDGGGCPWDTSAFCLWGPQGAGSLGCWLAPSAGNLGLSLVLFHLNCWLVLLCLFQTLHHSVYVGSHPFSPCGNLQCQRRINYTVVMFS